MHRKALVCRRDVFFRLKILSFGKKCDEVVQMKIRGIRKAIFCETLTYSERAESQLSPKVSLTTICDLHLLLRVLDRWECFPSLRRSRLQFFCYFNIGTTEVEDSSFMIQDSNLTDKNHVWKFFFSFLPTFSVTFSTVFFFNGFKSLFVSTVSISGPLIKMSEVSTSRILPLKRYGRWDNFIITKYRDKSFYEKFSTELNFLICYFVCIDVIFGRVSRFKT